MWYQVMQSFLTACLIETLLNSSFTSLLYSLYSRRQNIPLRCSIQLHTTGSPEWQLSLGPMIGTSTTDQSILIVADFVSQVLREGPATGSSASLPYHDKAYRLAVESDSEPDVLIAFAEDTLGPLGISRQALAVYAQLERANTGKYISQAPIGQLLSLLFRESSSSCGCRKYMTRAADADSLRMLTCRVPGSRHRRQGEWIVPECHRSVAHVRRPRAGGRRGVRLIAWRWSVSAADRQ